MSLAITAFYAALLALVVTALGAQIGRMRLSAGISILHGDNMELATKIRRHANFTENVPLALILMGAIEVGGASSVLLHVLGIALVTARIAHPIGLQHDNISHPLRAVGAFGTLGVTLVAAGMAIWQFVS